METVFRDTVDMEDSAPLIDAIGVIGLGVKKRAQSGKEYPSEVPYFVLDDPSAHPVVEALESLLKRKLPKYKTGEDGPARLPFIFTHESPQEVAPVTYESWRASKSGAKIRVCYGNGDVGYRLIDGSENGERQERECPCEWFTSQPKQCGKPMRLFFMLPWVSVSGCFRISTQSKVSLSRVRADIENVRNVTRIVWPEGRISSLMDTATGKTWLELAREKWQSTRDGKTHYCIRVRLRDFVTLDYLTGIRKTIQERMAIEAAPQQKRIKYEPQHERAQGNDIMTDGSSAPVIADNETTSDEDTDLWRQVENARVDKDGNVVSE